MSAHAAVGEPAFARRVARLPALGLGISTEFGARHQGLELLGLRSSRPDLVRFLEVGCDLARGLDQDARAWCGAGLPTTYHFLDLNLEDPADLDSAWIEETGSLARSIGAAWLCGDAGSWHVGPRERGHGVLMAPILEESSAAVLAGNVARLRRAIGFEVLPENPPAHVYLGRMHLVDYFARVCELADSGLLLDVAHLAVFQRVRGHEPFERFEHLPFERIVELHVAGGTPFEVDGARFVDDDHGVAILPETFELLEAVLPRACNLKALVFECERNRVEQVLPVFERLDALLASTAGARDAARTPDRPSRAGASSTPAPAPAPPLPLARVQRSLFRMQADEGFARELRARRPATLRALDLPTAALALLLCADARGLRADPGGRRRAQVVGNLLGEYPLAHACALAEGEDPAFADAFLAAPEFHAAMHAALPLPPAFGRWLERLARESGSAARMALARLELALVTARRGPLGDVGGTPASPDEALVRSPHASLLELPSGTHALAVALRTALDSSEPRPDPGWPRVDEQQAEWLLLLAAPRTSPQRVAELEIELLAPPTDRLLAAFEEPHDRAARTRLACELGAEPEELERFVAELIRDGVLVAADRARAPAQRRT